MFAVIKTGGKQYKVAKNDVIKIEKVSGETGSVIVFEDVLAVGEGGKVTLGTPTVANMKVSAEVLGQVKDDKVIIFKKRRRHNYRRKKGHRQQVTWLRVQEIGEGLTPKKAAPKKEEAKKETKPAAEAKKEIKKETSKKSPVAKKAEKKVTGEKNKPAAKKASAKKTDKE